MYERYAPIQRKVRPSVWREAIRGALELRPDQWPAVPSASASHADDGVGNAPRSLKVWEARHPDRYERLKRVRRVLNGIADDTRTPVEMILKPQIVRNLCWVDDPASLDVAGFLAAQGARDWQVRLVAASVSRVIM